MICSACCVQALSVLSSKAHVQFSWQLHVVETSEKIDVLHWDARINVTYCVVTKVWGDILISRFKGTSFLFFSCSLYCLLNYSSFQPRIIVCVTSTCFFISSLSNISLLCYPTSNFVDSVFPSYFPDIHLTKCITRVNAQ